MSPIPVTREGSWNGVSLYSDPVPGGTAPYGLRSHNGSAIPPGFAIDENGIITSGNFAPAPTAQTIGNYLSGISLVLQDATEAIWEAHDSEPMINPRGVLHLKRTTNFKFGHNALNEVGWRNLIDPGGGCVVVGDDPDPDVAGVIRHRIDYEHSRWPRVFTDFYDEGSGWPLFGTDWRNFNTLDPFPNNDPVVGSIGPVPDVEPTVTALTDGTYYHRGVLGPNGEESHVIAVSDDDMVAAPTNGVFGSGGGMDSVSCSDGRSWTFVVADAANQLKVPVLLFFKADSTGMFTTTPYRRYFTPKVFPQKTVYEGAVTLEIVGLDLRRCQYKLVPHLTDPDTVDWIIFEEAIDLSELADDAYFDLYYKFETSEEIATRVMFHYVNTWPHEGPGTSVYEVTDAVDDPVEVRRGSPNFAATGFASLANTQIRTFESVGDETVFRPLYNERYVSDKNNWDFYYSFGGPYYQAPMIETGYRNCDQFGDRVGGAVYHMLMEGLDSLPTWKKQMIHDRMVANTCNLDLALGSVGVEGFWGTSSPVAERTQSGGYYTSQCEKSMAMGYDWIISDFKRSEALPQGFSPVEDFRMREVLASVAGCSNFISTSFTYGPSIGDGSFGRPAGYATGMWDTARFVRSLYVASSIPNYRSPAYGMCGAPHKTIGGTPPTHYGLPGPADIWSWWDYLDDIGITITDGAGNARMKSGVHGGNVGHEWGIITGTIAAVASGGKFTDSADGFITAGYRVGDCIETVGFTTPANNGRWAVDAVSAGEITVVNVVNANVPADEAAGTGKQTAIQPQFGARAGYFAGFGLMGGVFWDQSIFHKVYDNTAPYDWIEKAIELGSTWHTVVDQATIRSSGSTDTDPYVSVPRTHIQPGTVTITFNETVSGTPRTVVDANAILVGGDLYTGDLTGDGASGTINYLTGEISLSSTANNVDDSTVLASYRRPLLRSSLDVADSEWPLGRSDWLIVWSGYFPGAAAGQESNITYAELTGPNPAWNTYYWGGGFNVWFDDLYEVA